MKNFLIGVLVVAVVVLAYLQFRTKDNQRSVPTNQVQNTTGDTKSLSTYKFGDTAIKYDSSKWKIEENRYCTPAQQEPCPVVGTTFTFLSGTSNDTIIVGGHQPMECKYRIGATKCSDTYTMSTSSNNKEVLDFYDYLLSAAP